MSKRVTHTVYSDGTSSTSTSTYQGGCSGCATWIAGFFLFSLIFYPAFRWPLLWILYAPVIVLGVVIWISNRRERSKR